MKKILLIEDDQIVANVYRNKLAVEGYQVEIAPDGEAGGLDERYGGASFVGLGRGGGGSSRGRSACRRGLGSGRRRRRISATARRDA